MSGTAGDDLFIASSGNESFDGGDGIDTVSYAPSTTGVYANLATGQSTPLLRIMPFGDSITFGVISSGNVKNTQSGGYRVNLWNDLQDADLAIDYVGTIQSGPSTFPDRDNQGFRGETIDYLDSVDAGLLSTLKPNVVFLMIGTNDTKDNSASQMIAELRDLIESIAAAAPNATIFVSTIPPIHDTTRNAIVDAYNAMIPGLVDELNDTLKVNFVDNTNLTLSDVSTPPADGGVHPTAAGYEKMATNWFNALIASGLFEGERDSLVSIENLTGSALNDRLVGDDSANVLSGLAGNDELTGAGGNDWLDGGAGIDRLSGGIGDDTYVVDSKSDVVIENPGEGNDTVRVNASFSLASSPDVENLTYTGASKATLTGNAAANRIEGGSGSDTIDGGGGADIMVGGAGSDTYTVDDVGDVIVESTKGGTDVVKAAVSFTLGPNVEKLTLTGSSAIDGTGNELANTLNGNSAANSLYGLAGNDTLAGMAGDDRLEGGDGSDVLRGGTGFDVLLGGAGNDKFDWDSIAESGLGATRDQVLDFTSGKDRLDLTGIDARAGTSANDAFTFIGTSAFSGVAGELRYELANGTGGDFTLVQVDVNGDGAADFEIALVGHTTALQGTDFLL